MLYRHYSPSVCVGFSIVSFPEFFFDMIRTVELRPQRFSRVRNKKQTSRRRADKIRRERESPPSSERSFFADLAYPSGLPRFVGRRKERWNVPALTAALLVLLSLSMKDSRRKRRAQLCFVNSIEYVLLDDMSLLQYTYSV